MDKNLFLNHLEHFHSLSTETFYFREILLSDAPDMLPYVSDEDVSRFIGWSLMTELSDLEAFLKNLQDREKAGTHLYASVVLKETEKVIGNVMIFNLNTEAAHAEVGYLIHKDHWGKGIGGQLVSIMNAFSKDTLGLHKVHGTVVSENHGSAKVLSKNGYLLEGRLRDYFFIEGTYYDSLLFGKLL